MANIRPGERIGGEFWSEFDSDFIGFVDEVEGTVHDASVSWRTRDGRVVRISEMSDRHIYNTIRWMRRHPVVRVALELLALDADRYAETAPEGAADAAQQTVAEALRFAAAGPPWPGWAADLAFPQHAAMVAEHERRFPSTPRVELGPVRPPPKLVDPDVFPRRP